jgi:hypothetical protein
VERVESFIRIILTKEKEMINNNLPPQNLLALPDKKELAVAENFEASLEEVWAETKSLDSWKPYETLPTLSEGFNYSKCLSVLDRSLVPASEKESKLSIAEMIKTCFALGWAPVDSDFKIFGKIYYDTLSHLPQNFLLQTLAKALKTWSHGQYSKMPTPAFLIECIPDAFHEIKHKRSRLDFAKMLENKSKERAEYLKLVEMQKPLGLPMQKIDVALTFLKKIETHEND